MTSSATPAERPHLPHLARDHTGRLTELNQSEPTGKLAGRGLVVRGSRRERDHQVVGVVFGRVQRDVVQAVEHDHGKHIAIAASTTLVSHAQAAECVRVAGRLRLPRARRLWRVVDADPSGI